MSNISIKVENISKRYRIGLKEEQHDTFFGALTSWVKYPLSNFRRVQKLSKFGENLDSKDIFWALKDVSFELESGGALGIIGRNGAGKSTLLKILCRITEPTSGHAFINGRVASLLEVGTGFHPELTGRENVFLNGTILGMTKAEIERKFDEIVDFSGVEKFIDTPVKRYSSGMRVRLAFAVAAHLDPEILLIDEVLAVGDIEFQNKCLGKMKNVATEGRTVLFVSHNMGSIESLCQRTILLDKGKIVEDGIPNSVINRYIKGDNKIPGEKIWDSASTTNDPKNIIAGDEIGYFKAIRSINQNGNVCTEFSVTEDIYLQMEYELFKDITKYFEINYWLKNGRGELVFMTSDPSLYDEKGCFRSKGSYKSTCKIPGNLLNDDIYFVMASIQEKKIVHLREWDVLSFIINDDWDINGSRGLCRPNNQWPRTAIRPKLEWETIRS